MRRRLIAKLAPISALAICVPFLASGPNLVRASGPRTEVVRWSPLDASGDIKGTFRVKNVRGGCDDGSTSRAIGGVGYHCGLSLRGRDFLIDPCWRAGPGRTNYVVCVTAPWARIAYRLRVSNLLLDDGVTYAAAVRVPWAIEMIDGDRCVILQGATGPLGAPKEHLLDRYTCAQGVELGDDVRRTAGLWTVSSARLGGSDNGYTHPRRATIRRVYYGGLPPAMARQNSLAASAATAALRVMRVRQRRAFGGRPYEVHTERVRLAFPSANWANVRGFVFFGVAGERHESVILRRTRRGWTVPQRYGRPCRTLPLAIRKQLLSPTECSHVR
jgi:hypothetical protein